MNIRFLLAACAVFVLSHSPVKAAEDLPVVVVTATRQPARVSDLVADVTVVEREEIERAGQTPLAEFLARQPGIEFTSNGSLGSQNDILVRGASTNQTVVLIDGMRVGSATQGNFNWSRMPLSQIDRVEILRGPASSLYGSDAIGGVIQIFTRRGAGPTRVAGEIGYGSYNTLSANASVAGGADGWRYNLSAESLKSDGFSNSSNPLASRNNVDRDGYEASSVGASVSFEPGSGHELAANFLYSTGRSRFDTGTTAATRAIDYVNGQMTQSVNLQSRNALTSLWTSTVRLGVSADDSTQYNNGIRNSLFRTDQQQLTWQNDVRLPSAGTLMLAWESLKQGITSTTAYPVKGRNVHSLIAGWSVNPADHRIQASIRRDINSQFGGKSTGTLGYGYQFTPEWRAYASAGTSFRAPTFNQLYFPGFGSATLRPEEGRSREIAAHYEGAVHRASVTVYRNVINNLIPTSQAINLNTATLKGETLTYQGRVRDFDLQLSFDHLSPKDEQGRILPRRAERNGTLAVGRADAGWDWRAELVASGMRYDDVANVSRLGGYTLANLAASRPLEPGWTLFGRINNLFNRKYETVLDFSTSGANLFVGLRYTPK